MTPKGRVNNDARGGVNSFCAGYSRIKIVIKSELGVGNVRKRKFEESKMCPLTALRELI